MRPVVRVRAFLAEWLPLAAGVGLLGLAALEAYRGQGCGSWKALLAGLGLLGVRVGTGAEKPPDPPPFGVA